MAIQILDNTGSGNSLSHIIDWTLMNTFQYFNKTSVEIQIFVEENEAENVIGKMSAILLSPHFV